MANKYKIKIRYSKYQHEYKADLLEHWFTITLFGYSFPVYTGVFCRRGSVYTIAKSVHYWMTNLGITQDMVDDRTGREFVS